MRIGFLGLGGMGLAMARNLLQDGHQIVAWNRTAEVSASLKSEGAVVADTAAQAAEAPIVMSMLADDAAVEAVMLASGAIDAMPKGAIHVCFATISVALSDRLNEAHQSRGQSYVAAPVFGRPDAAVARKLFIAAAGNMAALDQLRPLFEAISQRVFMIGENPSQANLVKLSGNFLITCVIESLAEVFAIVEKGGVEPRVVHELLTETLFSAPIYRIYGPMILDQKFKPAGFKLALGLKDNRLLQQAAEALNVPLPFASIIRDRMLATLANNDPNSDWSSFAVRAAEDAGLKRRE